MDRVEPEQGVRCLNINKLRVASRSHNLWVLPPSLQMVFEAKLFDRKRNGERFYVVHTCTNEEERRRKRQILKCNNPGFSYVLGLLGAIAAVEYIHCAYRNFTLQK